ALVSQQVLEQFELATGEIDQLVATDDTAADEIELEIRNLEPQHIGGTASAHQGANPCEELRQRERFHQVVVGAEIEPEHAIINAVTGREDQDRRVDAALAQCLQDL